MAGTRWVRLDVDYFHNPKVLAAGRNARDLHLASICWMGRLDNDGLIPEAVVDTIANDAGLASRARAAAVERVVCSGLWIPVGAGFELKDYLEFNPSKAQKERAREVNRARQKNFRSEHRNA